MRVTFRNAEPYHDARGRRSRRRILQHGESYALSNMSVPKRRGVGRRSAPAVERVKVAIVGGGCAGVTAAWELVKLNRLKNEKKTPGPYYDITLYERSHRLGGKGASGRDKHGRIREHGLHIWLGFYENAFGMMRECYRIVQDNGWGPNAEPGQILPHGSFDEAFFPEPHVGVATKNRGNEWEAWTGYLPPMKGLPGDPLDLDTNPFTLAGYLTRCIGLTKALLHSVLDVPGSEAKPGAPRPDGRSSLDEKDDLDFGIDPTRSPGLVVERMARLVRFGLLSSAAGLLQGATILESWLRERNPAPQLNSTILKFLEALATQTRKQLRDVVMIDEHLRRKTEIIDLIITIIVGLYQDRVLFDARGLDAINDIDCKAWLIKHGALESSVQSPFVTGLYDLAFCYEDGDRSKPSLAAGQALRGALRMFFTYRGSLFWRMRSGMGDAVFAPLYKVLAKNKVRFEFLHELHGIDFDLDSPDKRIKGLTFKTPMRLAKTSPLDTFGCWPHEPVTKRSPEGKEERHVIDFDVVVLAMGIDDFSSVCPPEFFKALPHWQLMRDKVKTIGTQAAQVWLKKDLTELGWRRGPVLVSAMDAPLETWADMTHTLATERAWRANDACANGQPEPTDDVRSIAYFCGPLKESEIRNSKGELKDRRAIEAGVKGALTDLLASKMKPFWPDAFKSRHDQLLKSCLAGDGKTPDPRLGDQHVQANFKGSDRYTLAMPRSLEHRISPLDNSVVNMTIAGDWTECGFNEGCVEAAVMSGMLAAHAISGKPDFDSIIGYDHP